MSNPSQPDPLLSMKAKGEKIACLTAYDYSFARIVDECGIDLILVGDSLGNVIQGREDTLKVSMADMIYHTRNVRRGVQRALLAADLPHRSYENPRQALDSARALVEEGGAEVVKLEGGSEVTGIVSHLREAGLRVCGHVGLQPQSIERYGGYKVQGREPEDAERIHADALALEAAGAELLVLECIPVTLAERISADLRIPTIGIGAGPGCDGQILVLYDVLGLSPYIPRMANDFLPGRGSIRAAVTAYCESVRAGSFPDASHSFT